MLVIGYLAWALKGDRIQSIRPGREASKVRLKGQPSGAFLKFRDYDTMSDTDVNDPKLESWISVKPDADFPIQNLPFGIFQSATRAYGVGVAIGDHVLDLAVLLREGFFDGQRLRPDIFDQPSLNPFLALGRRRIRDVRERVSVLLRKGNDELSSSTLAGRVVIPQSSVRMLMPVAIPNYTDFYSSEEHATNVGSMFRDPANALLPNWKHLPVAYHGRASSIVVSGTNIRRPWGQVKDPAKPAPEFLPTKKLDFELELAFVTCGTNPLGSPVTTSQAEDYIAGFVLFNDWSARDIQQWEYAPLGPFLGKNFASSISPWLVTLDALEPFRVAGPVQHPPVLPYLSHAGDASFNIALEVELKPEGGEGLVICRSNSRHLYWNIRQQLAHHTVNGCNVQVGDMYASGTISGPEAGSFGSMLELAWNGQRPLSMPDGTTRAFLEDGDTVTMSGRAARNGLRIGFGTCVGKVVPALVHDFR